MLEFRPAAEIVAQAVELEEETIKTPVQDVYCLRCHHVSVVFDLHLLICEVCGSYQVDLLEGCVEESVKEVFQ